MGPYVFVCVLKRGQKLSSLSVNEVVVVAVIGIMTIVVRQMEHGREKNKPPKPIFRFLFPSPSSQLAKGSSFSSSLSNFRYLSKRYSVELGRIGAVPYRLLARDSAIVFGPTQSFKTSRFVVPAIVNFHGAVIVSSVKSDVLDQSITQRRSRGPVAVFDPFGVTKEGNSYFDPLQYPIDLIGAKRLADIICGADNALNTTEESKFWYSLAARLLYPLLFAASHLGLGLSAVIEWVDDRNFTIAGEFLTKNQHEAARRSLSAGIDREERQLSSVVTTLEKCLAPFQFGTSAFPDYKNLAKYQPKGESTLYLIAPPNRQREIGSVFGATLTAIFDQIYSESSNSELLVALDEAANLAPIPNLDEIVSTVASFGITMLSIFQDVAQVRARYGDRSATIINNHRAKIFLGASSDPETINLAELLCGGARRPKFLAASSAQANDIERQLLPRGRLRSLMPGQALVVYSHRDPAVITLVKPVAN